MSFIFNGLKETQESLRSLYGRKNEKERYLLRKNVTA
jgi:hypothetical protein